MLDQYGSLLLFLEVFGLFITIHEWKALISRGICVAIGRLFVLNLPLIIYVSEWFKGGEW